MNWEAIGAIGETIGALAVVITLTKLVDELLVNADPNDTYTQMANWANS